MAAELRAVALREREHARGDAQRQRGGGGAALEAGQDAARLVLPAAARREHLLHL